MNKGKIHTKLIKRFSVVLVSVLLSLLFVSSIPAQQTPPVGPAVRVEDAPKKPKTGRVNVDKFPRAVLAIGGSTEKSIAVSDNVNISLCVNVGQVKVAGWDRNEVRAFVKNGRGVGFSVLDKRKSDKSPVWIKILGFDPSSEAVNEGDECISGAVIELDVPTGSTVNLKSGESNTTIDSVAKVSVKNVGGDIYLSNITKGIDARTYRGNLTVKDSNGSISLETTNGNIVAYNAVSEEIGDLFLAKTNSGAITLQKLQYRQTEANSSSGSISFAGEISANGQYYFGSTVGLISLILPEETSAKIVAVYGYGNFDSEIALKDLKRDESSNLKSLTCTLGDGGALINFKTANGKIIIKKE